MPELRRFRWFTPSTRLGILTTSRRAILRREVTKRLRDAGVPQSEAEAHAEAARDFVMAELVTKTDLQAAVAILEARIDTQTLRLTVRLGVMLVAAISILAVVLKLH